MTLPTDDTTLQGGYWSSTSQVTIGGQNAADRLALLETVLNAAMDVYQVSVNDSQTEKQDAAFDRLEDALMAVLNTAPQAALP